mmetsp:Transcript_56906/g.132654  ORF Transcript_56906/g.132654 Transcript_56906/m.132654 type:complete len:264 (+) Transcript_56906:66-857(+)
MLSKCWFAAFFLAWALDAADPCECLNWKQVYASRRVRCGEGLEFHVFEGALGYDLPGISYIEKNFKSVYEQFCTSFLARMDNRYCVNLGMYPFGTPGLLGGQWCYVDRRCSELNGGRAVPDKQEPGQNGWFLAAPSPSPLVRDVSWKACVAGKDQRLREMAPLDLLALGEGLGCELGHLTKIAYTRLMPPNHTWASVQRALAKADPEAMPLALRAAIAANVPIVIDEDPGGQGNQKIVRGHEVYDLANSTGWPYRRMKDLVEL